MWVLGAQRTGAGIVAAPEVDLLIPRRVAGLRFADRNDSDNPGEGTQVRFTDGKTLLVDVFVYPGPGFADDCPMRCAADAFVAEVFTAFTQGPALEDLPAPTTDSLLALLALLAGTWDWETADSVCATGTFAREVSADRRDLVLRYLHETDSTGAPSIVRYSIVEAGSQVLPWASHTVRMTMQGETRTTEAGDLVVWDLIFDTRDRYVWHRTDRDRGGTTRGTVRCGD